MSRTNQQMQSHQRSGGKRPHNDSYHAQRRQDVSRQYHTQKQTAYGQAQYRKDSSGYQRGTAVKEPSFEELLEEAPKKKPNHNARKNREKAVQMNFGYVVFLVGALAFAAVTLIGYINLQSDITNSVKRVSRMESELYALRQDNDEYETRINSSIDLEEVKRIAICELGMKYASEGQIIRVEGGGDDYARKYAEIPQE